MSICWESALYLSIPPDIEPYRNFFTSTKKATQNWVRAATKTETLHDVTVGTNCWKRNTTFTLCILYTWTHILLFNLCIFVTTLWAWRGGVTLSALQMRRSVPCPRTRTRNQWQSQNSKKVWLPLAQCSLHCLMINME